MDIKELKREFDSARAYFGKIKLVEKVDKCVKYYEGDQWSENNTLDNTRPRSQSNWVEMIVDAKVSSVLSGQVKVKYESLEHSEAADRYNAFTASKWLEMDLDAVTDQAVNDAAIKRCGIVYLYWDNDARQSAGASRGGILSEVVDVRDFYVADPEVKDVQKQKYIIVAKRIDKELAKRLCDNDVDQSSIADDVSTLNDEPNADLVTVYTKFYRINGEVHYVRFTDNIVLHAPRSMRPICECDKQGSDVAEYSVAEQYNGEERAQCKFDKYPFATFTWKNKDKSFYGRGEVEGLLINQKAFNNARALEAESLQVTSIPTLVTKSGAQPTGQVITNNPRQVLRDMKAGERGYYYLVAPQVNSSLAGYADKIVSDTRVSTNSTEIVTGEIDKQLSALAYARLQAQADKPVKRLRRRFYRFIKAIGRILECYYKLYYNEEENATYDTEDGESQPFIGSQSANIDFSVDILVGESGEYTQFGEIGLAKESLDAGQISFQQYLTMLPSEVFPNKDKLIGMIAENEKSALAQQKQQIEQMAAEMEKVADVLKDIVPIITENERLKTKLAEVVAKNNEGVAKNAELIRENAEQRGVIDSVLQEMRPTNAVIAEQE